MLRKIGSISLIAGLMMSATCMAQAPAAAPAGSTGLCRDGTYWTGATKRGACHGHKGVQDWYATDSGSAATGCSRACRCPRGFDGDEKDRQQLDSPGNCGRRRRPGPRLGELEQQCVPLPIR
jgi:hypothetical protein